MRTDFSMFQAVLTLSGKIKIVLECILCPEILEMTQKEG